jgi:hypothetical protein
MEKAGKRATKNLSRSNQWTQKAPESYKAKNPEKGETMRPHLLRYNAHLLCQRCPHIGHAYTTWQPTCWLVTKNEGL